MNLDQLTKKPENISVDMHGYDGVGEATLAVDEAMNQFGHPNYTVVIRDVDLDGGAFKVVIGKTRGIEITAYC